MRTRLPELPADAGAYRWFYADVTAGEVSAVCIFMVGSLFSPRYSVAARRGGRPQEHCAVNFALYVRGERRAWVLSEYPKAHATPDGRALAIGRSVLRLTPEGRIVMEVDERTAPWGRPFRARLELTPRSPVLPEVELVPGLPHHWQALAPHAHAHLVVPGAGVDVYARGYHDTNHGAEPLGLRLPGWTWARTHLAGRTVVDYRLPPGVPSLVALASEEGFQLERRESPAAPGALTGWGLRVPARLVAPFPAGDVDLGAPRLLESSPFYARLEAHGAGAETMGEVADFRRFHSPLIRWMAHFRTRIERAA